LTDLALALALLLLLLLPAGYASLMALVGEPSPASLAQAATLQPALCQALGKRASNSTSQGTTHLLS
jgi:hypothetical protein